MYKEQVKGQEIMFSHLDHDQYHDHEVTSSSLERGGVTVDQRVFFFSSEKVSKRRDTKSK